MHCHSNERQWNLHNALLIEWYLVFAWRQRNVRECRLEHNLIYGPLPECVHFKQPEWVEQARVRDRRTKFWWYYFREDETKINREVRGIVPRRIVRPLERYLTTCRSSLVADRTTDNLFLNRNGEPHSEKTMRALVTEITYEHTGRRVTPHLFRDIFAYNWLDQHPKDYLTLSKILWHIDLDTTLRIYGEDFDESDGACSIDRWLG